MLRHFSPPPEIDFKGDLFIPTLLVHLIVGDFIFKS